jgi:hypothetical protein
VHVSFLRTVVGKGFFEKFLSLVIEERSDPLLITTSTVKGLSNPHKGIGSPVHHFFRHVRRRLCSFQRKLWTLADDEALESPVGKRKKSLCNRMSDIWSNN